MALRRLPAQSGQGFGNRSRGQDLQGLPRGAGRSRGGRHLRGHPARYPQADHRRRFRGRQARLLREVALAQLRRCARDVQRPPAYRQGLLRRPAAPLRSLLSGGDPDDRGGDVRSHRGDQDLLVPQCGLAPRSAFARTGAAHQLAALPRTLLRADDRAGMPPGAAGHVDLQGYSRNDHGLRGHHLLEGRPRGGGQRERDLHLQGRAPGELRVDHLEQVLRARRADHGPSGYGGARKGKILFRTDAPPCRASCA